MNDKVTIQWRVRGMDCSGCKVNIERVLSKMPGVLKGEVNFMSAQLTVDFEMSKTNQTSIEQIVNQLGFGLEIFDLNRSNEATAEVVKTNADESSRIRSRLLSFWKYKNSKQLCLAGVLFLSAFLVTHFSEKPLPFLWPVATITAAFPVLKKAFFGIRSGLYFSIESLMSLAVIGSFFIGASEEAAMVVVLFLFGEWLEGFAAARARKNIGKLLEIAPKMAWKVTPTGSTLVNVADLAQGDTVEVKPGSRIPTDGIVLSGESQVDQSLLTGESLPMAKKIGDFLPAGALNFDGLLKFKVTATAQNNTLSQIMALIEKAESSKAPTERFIEKFSRVYTPIVVFLAAMVALLPPMLLQQEVFATWIYRAMGILLIGCPCALLISVPASVSAAIARGARFGILIKGGAALEKIAHAKSICFDKTGTLTQGFPVVKACHSFSGFTENDLASIAGSVAQSSEHPLAKAVVQFAKSQDVPLLPVTSATAEAGQGITGVVEGSVIKIVSVGFAKKLIDGFLAQEKVVEAEENQGRTVSAVLFGSKGKWTLAGLFSFQDELKNDAVSAIRELKRLGFQPLMLTGDRPGPAKKIQISLGIEMRSELLPGDKLKFIEDLKNSSGPVLMVGDGINDAPALAAADVGIAYSSGTEIAAECADVVLMGDKVGRVTDLVNLARSTKSIVTQNIGFAIGMKAFFLVTTLFGFTGLWIAVLSDTGATVIVTLNALRLLAWNNKG
jgi:Zn2+/Cd2+-exporting ATPase